MATITINLDDKASAGLEALAAGLDGVKASTEQLTTAGQELTDQESRQITVIHEHRAGLSSVGTAMAGVVERGLQLAAVLAPIIERQRILASLQGALSTGLSATSAVLATHAARWKSFEKAGSTAVKSIVGRLTGFGPATAAATIAVAGWAAVMDNTGKRSVGWMDDFSKATDEQIRKYERLIEEANRYGKTVDEIAESKGIDIEKDLGIKLIEQFESNLDRIKASAGGLAGDLKEPFDILAGSAKNFVNNLNPIPPIWNEIDASATRSADQMVENINILRDYVSGTRKLEEAMADYEERVRQTADDFARLRELNSKWAADDETGNKVKAAREYAEELGKIPKTLNHNLELERSVSDQSLQVVIARLENEMRKRQQAAGEAAAAGKFTVEQAKQHEIEMNALRDERKAREQELDALLKSLPEARLRHEAETQKRNNEAMRAAYDERVKLAEEANQRLMEIEDEAAAIRRQTILQARNEFLDDIATRLKLEQDDRKAAIENSKMTASQKEAAVKQIEAQSRQESHALRLAQIREQRDQELGLSRARLQDAIRDAKDTNERTAAEHKARLEEMRITAKAERDLSAENSAFNRRELEKQVSDRRQAAAEVLKTEQEKAAKLKAMREQVLEKAGFNAKDVLNQADPRAVRNRLAEEAGQKARQQAALDNSDLFKEAQFDTRGEAMRQYKRRLARAQAEAERESRKQFAQGKVDPDQIAQAQADVQKQNLGLFQKQNNLSADLTQTMAEGIQGAAVEQARVDALERQVEQLRQSQQRMTQAGLSAQQRQRAQVGSQ